MPTAAQIKAAQKIVQNASKFLTKDRWAQGAEAYAIEDGNEEEVDVHDPNAEKFCMIGGLKKIGTTRDGEFKNGYDIAINAVSVSLGACGDDDGEGIPEFNDNEDTTHAQVQAQFKQAQKVLEAQLVLAKAGLDLEVKPEDC